MNHAQQLATIPCNHALHTVLQERESLLTAHTELLNERIRRIDSLTEIHIVSICQCPHTDGQVIRIVTLQPRRHGGHIRLAVQFVVIVSPHLRGSNHSSSTSRHRSSGGKCSRSQRTHQFRIDAKPLTER